MVRYIDSNPALARIVEAPWHYKWGSASQYVHGSGPIWLSREWVESEVRTASGRQELCIADYSKTFGRGSPEAIARLVESRWCARKANTDSLDDLIGSAPMHVRQWMKRKALLADGLDIGEPVCDSQVVLEVCRHSPLAPDHLGRLSNTTLSKQDIVTVGLFRTLIHDRWEGIMKAIGQGETTTRRALKWHQALLVDDPDYIVEVAHLSADALRRCTGG